MAERLGTTQEAVDRRVTDLFTNMAAGASSGGASAVDDMKRLHAAVVAKQAAAATLSSYVPQRVAEKLAGGEVEREELEVTVLFSDIRGFSDDGRTAGGQRDRRDRRAPPLGDGRDRRRAPAG